LRDPAGNLIEIDWPDVETLDRSRIPEMKLLTEFAHKTRRGSLPPYLEDRTTSEIARNGEMAGDGRKPNASMSPGRCRTSRAHTARYEKDLLIPEHKDSDAA
jgi:hypothetical protein